MANLQQTQGQSKLTAANSTDAAQHVTPAGPELGEALMASNDSGEFTLLPGTMPGSLDDPPWFTFKCNAALSALSASLSTKSMPPIGFSWICWSVTMGSRKLSAFRPPATKFPAFRMTQMGREEEKQ